VEAGKSSASARDAALFGAEASRVGRLVAGDPVVVKCHGTTSWRATAAELGVDPTSTWGVTPFHWSSVSATAVPDGVAHLSPRACHYGDAFWQTPTELGARTCRMADQTDQAGRPAFGECDHWAAKLTALHVLSHESMHLAGFYREANAECLGVQIDALVAIELGADERFARSLAREYWTDYYAPRRDQYWTAACRDRGSLDLFPKRQGWPTPRTYPRDLSRSLTQLRSRLEASGRTA
jgi:hypothetical protein